jgi:hypothetical protein
MQVFYDARDVKHASKLGDRRFDWLEELGAGPLQDAAPEAEGFLFGYQNGIDDLRSLLQDRPNVRDRPDEREELVYLDRILDRLDQGGVSVPRPRSWIMRIDDPPPPDLTFPLFARTAASSWKRGGQVSRVKNLKQLDEECALLRRAFQWDATIIAREWLEVAPAGQWRYGKAPQEIRVWIVDGVPLAWSFHYLHVVPTPKGFPPSAADLGTLADCAAEIGVVFRSRLVAADFLRLKSGGWSFLEAGPGACCGTAHEEVFKAVARRLVGEDIELKSDAVGGRL